MTALPAGSSAQKSKPEDLRKKRWRDVLFMAGIGAFAVWAITPTLAEWLNPARFSEHGHRVIGTIGVLGLVAGGELAAQEGWLRCKGSWSYPPTWMAVVLGAMACAVGFVLLPERWLPTDLLISSGEWTAAWCLLAFYALMLPFFRWMVGGRLSWFVQNFFRIGVSAPVLVYIWGYGWHFGWMGLVVLFAACVVAASKRKKAYLPKQLGLASQNIRNADSAISTIATDDEAILEWLRSDIPIGEEAGDRFGLMRRARQVAGWLREPGEAGAITVAVVGALGSGKTSLRQLVDGQLKEPKLEKKSEGAAKKISPAVVRVVSVSAWPFENASALVAGLLDAVVRELGREAGVPILRDLPERYLGAIEGANGTTGKVLRALQGGESPERIIERIDEVATVLDFRVVLWVEDLERFAPGETDEGASPEQRERLAPVRALLHALQSTESIAIVVATTRLQAGFDMEKIARHIVELAPLRGEEVERVIGAVRREMARAYDEVTLFDPISDRERAWGALASIPKAPPVTDPKEIVVWLPPEPTDIDRLALIAGTPRALKQGLRTALERWKVLRGEIDPDHLLTIEVIRHCSPDIFAWIKDNGVQLRECNCGIDKRNCGAAIRQERARSDMKAFGQTAGMNRAEREAVVRIAEILFGSKTAPQGFGQPRPTDYLQRYIDEELPVGQRRDQELLKLLSEARQGDEAQQDEIAKLARTTMVDNWEGRRLRFLINFDEAALRRVLDAYLGLEISYADLAAVDLVGSDSGSGVVFNCLIAKFGDGAAWGQLLDATLGRLSEDREIGLPALGLLGCILRFRHAMVRDIVDDLNGELKGKMRAAQIAVWEQSRSMLDAEFSVVAKRLEGAPLPLFHWIFAVPKENSAFAVSVYERWSEVLDRLLDAAEKGFCDVLLPISGLIVEEVSKTEEPRVVCDFESAQRFSFTPNRLKRLAAIDVDLSAFEDDSARGRVSAMLEFARKQAAAPAPASPASLPVGEPS